MERLLNNKTNRVKKSLAKKSSTPFLGIPNILKTLGVLNPQNILSQNNFILYNKFNQSVRNSAYLELFFDMGVAGQSTVYNSFAFKNMKNIASISSASELIIPPTSPYYENLIYTNDKRFFMMDMYIQYNPVTGVGPDNLYFKFATSNTFFPIAKVESSTTGGGSNPYVAGPVYRNNMWIYYPYTQIYVLIRSNDNMNSYGFSIWVMQSYTNQVDTTLTLNTLPYIGTTLATNTTKPLPPNMCFSIINLSQYLNTTSIGNVDVMQDTLNNTYQYLDPTYCNFLYENIVNNNK